MEQIGPTSPPDGRQHPAFGVLAWGLRKGPPFPKTRWGCQLVAKQMADTGRAVWEEGH